MEQKESISLQKGTKVDLSKEAPGLENIVLALGWDVQKETNGPPFDLDVSVFMLNSSGKLPNTKNFVYFNNLKSPCGSVEHTGDNLTGVGDGDDESVFVDLSKVPADVNELHVVVNIYEAVTRKQNFGQVKNAFIRMYDKNTKAEVLRYDLSEDFSSSTAVLFGRVYRHNGVWKFEATGTGESAGLDAYMSRYSG